MGRLRAVQERVAKSDCSIWKSYEKEIEERDERLGAARARKWLKKEARRKVYTGKRNAHKLEVLARRQERKVRRRETIAQGRIENSEDLGDDTDDESISTLALGSDMDEDGKDETK